MRRSSNTPRVWPRRLESRSVPNGQRGQCVAVPFGVGLKIGEPVGFSRNACSIAMLIAILLCKATGEPTRTLFMAGDEVRAYVSLHVLLCLLGSASTVYTGVFLIINENHPSHKRRQFRQANNFWSRLTCQPYRAVCPIPARLDQSLSECHGF